MVLHTDLFSLCMTSDLARFLLALHRNIKRLIKVHITRTTILSQHLKYA